MIAAFMSWAARFNWASVSSESFSDLFERLAESQDSRQLLLKLKGTVDFTNKEQMLSEIYAKRAERRY